MIYRNTKTGAIIDSSCDISGGDWVKEKQPKPIPAKVAAEPIKKTQPAPKPTRPKPKKEGNAK